MFRVLAFDLQHTATHCTTLHHTATHCTTLQHTATHCNTLHTLHHSATHCMFRVRAFDLLRSSNSWVMSHTWISRVTRINESCHKCAWVMSKISTSHVAQMNESCHKYVARMNESCHKCAWVCIIHIRNTYATHHLIHIRNIRWYTYATHHHEVLIIYCNTLQHTLQPTATHYHKHMQHTIMSRSKKARC